MKFKKNFGLMNHFKKIYSVKNSLDSNSIRSLFNSIFSDSTYTISEDSLRHSYSFRLNVKCKDSLHPQHYSFYNLIGNNYESPYNSLDISCTLKRLNRQVKITKFLPRGRAYSGGNVSTYVFTKRDSRKWRRKAPQRFYIDSIKPAFDTFINTKLDSLIKSDSIEDFHVLAKFYSNGRVKVLNWNHSEYRKWSFSKFYANNIENFHDKRRTKKQLQKLDFKSFGLEYPIILSLDTYMFDYSD